MAALLLLAAALGTVARVDGASAAGVLVVRGGAQASQDRVRGLAPTQSQPPGRAAQEPGETYRNPVWDASFPDPMGLGTGVDYYAYSTGDRFPILHSTDLVSWMPAGRAFATAPVWSRGENPWAPSALQVAGPCPGTDSPACFLLYYTGLNRTPSPDANCIGVAHAPAPTGPFTDLGILDRAEGRPAYRAAVLETAGLAGYWRLGEAGGRRAADELGRAHGVYAGVPSLGIPGAIAGDPDTAAGFDGASQSARLPRPAADDLTLELWFRSEGGGAGTRARSWRDAAGLLDGRPVRASAASARDLGTALDAAGRVWAGIGLPGASLRSEPGFDDGSWHHVVFTRRSADGALALYVDGVQVDSGTGPAGPAASRRPLTLARTGPGGARFAGALDEVAVYARALSRAEVAHHHNRFPVGCGDAAGWSVIDPAPFVDADGRAYLYVSTTNPERTLGVIPLAPDLVHAAGPRVPLLTATQRWEQAPFGGVVENPWVVRRETAGAAQAPYYLFYSGGAFSGDYAMGYATAPGPLGPFVKAEENPILESARGAIGPGGGSLVTGPRTGREQMLYHARRARGAPRVLFLDRVEWDDPRVAVAGPTTSPQPLP